MCFVWISEQTAIISLYNINWPVFVTETQCVYCAVRTGSLYIIQGSGGWSSASRWAGPDLTQFNTCGICGGHWAQKQVNLTVFLFPPVSIMSAKLRTHPHSHYAPTVMYISQVYTHHSKSGSRWKWCQLTLHYMVHCSRCRSTHPHAHFTRFELSQPV